MDKEIKKHVEYITYKEFKNLESKILEMQKIAIKNNAKIFISKINEMNKLMKEDIKEEVKKQLDKN